MIFATILGLLAATAGQAGTVGQTRRLALVVGASSYGETCMGSVKADCREVAAVLREFGHYTVRMWGDGFGEPAGPKTGAGLIQWMTQQAKGDWDQILFYYSGHGVQLGDDAYLALDLPLTADEAAVTWLKPVDIETFLGGLGGDALVVIDSCNSDGYTRAIKASAPKPLAVSLYASANAGKFAYVQTIDEIERHLDFEVGVVRHEDLRAARHKRLLCAEAAIECGSGRPPCCCGYPCPCKGGDDCSCKYDPIKQPKHSTFNYFFCRGLMGSADGVVLKLPRSSSEACADDLVADARRDFGVDLIELSSYVCIALCSSKTRLATQEPWLRQSSAGGLLEIIPSAKERFARLQRESRERLGRKVSGVTYTFSESDYLCDREWTQEAFRALEVVIVEELRRLDSAEGAAVRPVYVDLLENALTSRIELRLRSSANPVHASFAREGTRFVREK